MPRVDFTGKTGQHEPDPTGVVTRANVGRKHLSGTPLLGQRVLMDPAIFHDHLEIRRGEGRTKSVVARIGLPPGK
jgi:hypothetical protein